MHLDPHPFFQRVDWHTDKKIAKHVDEAELLEKLTALGYPLTVQTPRSVLFDAVQCFQDSWGLGAPLTVDRWGGKATIAALDESLSQGGMMFPNISARELSDKRTRWIWCRRPVGEALQLMRNLMDRPIWVINTYRSISSNRAAGSTSFPSANPIKGKPGSRHIWAEAADWDSGFGITLGQCKELKIFTGMGVNKHSARRQNDKVVTHGDIGGTLSADRGSNRYARTGGIASPMVWEYNR